MNLSKVRLVVTDMDGTLLNNNHEVSPRFYEIFKQLKAKGILFAAASGRQYHSIVSKLEKIKDDIIVVGENGGIAKQKDEELLFTPLGPTHKNIIIDALAGVPNIHPVLCGKNKAYLLGNSDEFTNKLKEFYTEYEILDDLKAFDEELIKIAIYHFDSSEKYIYPHVKHLQGDLEVKVSGVNWVDISSPNANKGYALQMLQEKFGISPEETMVFGDYNNDLEMLSMAKFSFAMANAHPNVIAAANFTTLSNENRGVEYILERLIAAK